MVEEGGISTTILISLRKTLMMFMLSLWPTITSDRMICKEDGYV